jgi:sulfoxide reductase heme-binding subunit YedZ
MNKLTPISITLLKVIIHLVFLSTIIYLYLLIVSERLGADPAKEIIHFLGKASLNFLFVTLAITPLAKRLKQPLLMRLKRLLGLYSFAWVCLHLLAFFWFELNWQVGRLFEEIIVRPYLTLGMLAWTILLLLSITSINSIRIKMKQAWFSLHRWVYVALVLGAIHYYWSVKSGVIEPMIYFLIVLLLLAERKAYFKSLFKSILKAKN